VLLLLPLSLLSMSRLLPRLLLPPLLLLLLSDLTLSCLAQHATCLHGPPVQELSKLGVNWHSASAVPAQPSTPFAPHCEWHAAQWSVTMADKVACTTCGCSYQ